MINSWMHYRLKEFDELKDQHPFPFTLYFRLSHRMTKYLGRRRFDE